MNENEEIQNEIEKRCKERERWKRGKRDKERMREREPNKKGCKEREREMK